jgi:tryptophan halogenase
LSGDTAHGQVRSAFVNGIHKLVVAGTGPLAWIAAGGLLRALRHRQVEVWMVDTGASRDARIGRWTVPSQRGMHALLGISEPQLFQTTGATFKLATEHHGWQGEGSRFLHAHGDIGVDLGGVPLYKLIQSETLAGKPQRPEVFSLAGTAAHMGKFARPMGEGRVLTATFTYAFHLEDAPYTHYLRAHALKLGVREAAAPFAEVMSGDDGIDGLRLTDGQVIAADYFVDCSGPEARLLGRISDGARDDWSAWLPCDRMWSAAGPVPRETSALTQTFASSAGWSWRAPLAQGSMVGQVFSSRFQDEAAALTTLRQFEPALHGEPVLTHFSAGRRQVFWARNCVALGASAVQLEPLAGADLHLGQLGLATLIELFPRDRGSRIEAAEYNRVMAEYADGLRDFTLAHYRAGAARAGEFWAATRTAALPTRLADRLELYAASGRLNLLDHEPFEETDWAWLLLGTGCRPQSLEMHVRLHLARQSPQEIAALRQHVQQLAASMPPHLEYIRRLRAG